MTDPHAESRDGTPRGVTGVTWPHLTVLGVVVLTYGFELFNFNVSADEPLYWNAAREDLAQVWGWQGRWGMGATAWLLPSTDVPVVPLGIGLVATAVALWWLARRIGDLRQWEAAIATSLAIGLPTLAFHFSFTINALGLGLGFLASTACGVLIMHGGRMRMLAAVVIGAYAIGVYEGFAFVLLVVYLAVIWRQLRWTTVGTTAITLLGSTVTWFILGRISSASVPPEHAGYVKDILSLDDIASDPLGRLAYALSRTAGMVLERHLYFGYSNPLPAVMIAVVVIAAAAVALRRPRAERLLAALVLLGVVLVPLAAAFATRVLFQRSLVYLPVIAVVLIGFAAPALRARASGPAKYVVVGLAILAIGGNATIANGAFFTGTITTDEDITIASNVATTYRSLENDPGDGPAVAVIAPRSVEAARPETWAGRSTFELGVMNTPRTAVAFLRMRGLNVVEASEDERARGLDLMDGMPAYPAPGYLMIRDGLLLINLASIPGR